MIIIDENGEFSLEVGTLNPITSDHPVFKARIALGLPLGEWLYAPTNGHQLEQYRRAHASDAKKEEFLKNVKLYLKPYGPEVIARYTARGALSLNLKITKETLNG